VNAAIAWASGRATGGRPLNLFTTLGRTGGLFRGWLHFAGRLMPFGRLPRRDTELVILRVAHLRECVYEQNHHVRLGRRVGLTHDELGRVAEGPQATGWSDRERAILTAVDELVADRAITDASWEALEPHLPPARLVELTLLATHYDMLATVILTLGIEPEAR
jgi:AhpD family alkylhydroperoxidase